MTIAERNASERREAGEIMSSDQRSVFWLSVLSLGIVVMGSGWPVFHTAGLPLAHALGWVLFFVGLGSTTCALVGLALLGKEHQLTLKPITSRLKRPRLQSPIWFGEFTRKDLEFRVTKLLKQRDEMVEQRGKVATYTKELEEHVAQLMAVPVPERALDEGLVILFRTYGKRAYTTADSILREAREKCWTEGGWRGLAARLTKDYVCPQLAATIDGVESAIDAADGDAFDRAFSEFFRAYHKLTGLTWQFLRDGEIVITHQWLKNWVDANEAFFKEANELTHGIVPRHNLRQTLLLDAADGLENLLSEVQSRLGSR